VIAAYYPNVIRSALLAIVEVPTDAVYDILQEMLVYTLRAHPSGQQWLMYGLTDVPHDCLTSIEKQ
jgi:hypothetical protein